MARPKLPDGERRVHVDITLAPATLETLDALAAGRELPRSTMIGQLIRAEAERERRRMARG